MILFFSKIQSKSFSSVISCQHCKLDLKFWEEVALTSFCFLVALNLKCKYVYLVNWILLKKTQSKIYWQCTFFRWFTLISNLSTSCTVLFSKEMFYWILVFHKWLIKSGDKKLWRNSKEHMSSVVSKWEGYLWKENHSLLTCILMIWWCLKIQLIFISLIN